MIDKIQKLRKETGAGVMAVKKALEQAKGNEKKARAILVSGHDAIVAKKSARAAANGMIDSYVHNSHIGVLIEVNCETDFVARTDDFKAFVHDLALQIASTDPKDVAALLTQEFIKDPVQTIEQVLKALIAKTGENIVIKRFTRYALGQ